MPILQRGASEIGFFLERQPHVVMDFSIVVIAFESFLECVDSRGILSIDGERQAELFVSLTIVRIHAKRRSSLCNRIVGIFRAIKEKRKPTVSLRKSRH